MQGLIAVGRIHLVGILVATAEVGRRADRIPKGAIEAGSILGGIGQDPGVDECLVFQCVPDRPDTSVHHVRWGDDIGTGPGM